MSNPEMTCDTTDESMILLQGLRAQGVNHIMRKNIDYLESVISDALAALNADGVCVEKIIAAKSILLKAKSNSADWRNDPAQLSKQRFDLP